MKDFMITRTPEGEWLLSLSCRRLDTITKIGNSLISDLEDDYFQTMLGFSKGEVFRFLHFLNSFSKNGLGLKYKIPLNREGIMCLLALFRDAMQEYSVAGLMKRFGISLSEYRDWTRQIYTQIESSED